MRSLSVRSAVMLYREPTTSFKDKDGLNGVIHRWTALWKKGQARGKLGLTARGKVPILLDCLEPCGGGRYRATSKVSGMEFRPDASGRFRREVTDTG